MEYTTKVIAANLKRRREMLGLTRDDLAKQAEVNYNTIIKLENGANTNPTIRTLINLSKVLNKSIEWFLT